MSGLDINSQNLWFFFKEEKKRKVKLHPDSPRRGMTIEEKSIYTDYCNYCFTVIDDKQQAQHSGIIYL